MSRPSTFEILGWIITLQAARVVLWLNWQTGGVFTGALSPVMRWLAGDHETRRRRAEQCRSTAEN